MTAPLDFWFDFASPYGYLASTRIDDIAARHGRTVRWRPILLGAVFKVSGMKPVMEQPLRGEYLAHDVPRFARLLGVPLTMPAKMPLQRAGGLPGLLVAGAFRPGKGACAGQGDLPCPLGRGPRCRDTGTGGGSRGSPGDSGSRSDCRGAGAAGQGPAAGGNGRGDPARRFRRPLHPWSMANRSGEPTDSTRSTSGWRAAAGDCV